MKSPFKWQGKPSIFSSLHAYNGIDTRASIIASKKAKNTLVLSGSSKNRKPVTQSCKSALQLHIDK
jgi:hypothetical protein